MEILYLPFDAKRRKRFPNSTSMYHKTTVLMINAEYIFINRFQRDSLDLNGQPLCSIDQPFRLSLSLLDCIIDLKLNTVYAFLHMYIYISFTFERFTNSFHIANCLSSANKHFLPVSGHLPQSDNLQVHFTKSWVNGVSSILKVFYDYELVSEISLNDRLYLYNILCGHQRFKSATVAIFYDELN